MNRNISISKSEILILILQNSAKMIIFLLSIFYCPKVGKFKLRHKPPLGMSQGMHTRPHNTYTPSLYPDTYENINVKYANINGGCSNFYFFEYDNNTCRTADEWPKILDQMIKIIVLLKLSV
jgi:hypothetical protein